MMTPGDDVSWNDLAIKKCHQTTDFKTYPGNLNLFVFCRNNNNNRNKFRQENSNWIENQNEMKEMEPGK